MRKFLTVAVFALFTACGGDSSTQPVTASVVGTYQLSTINGSGLPFVLQAANPKVEILGDQLVVNAGGTFSQNTSIRVTNGTAVTTQTLLDAGTYTLNGTAATFMFNSDGSTGTATVGTNQLTIAEGGFSSVYKK